MRILELDRLRGLAVLGMALSGLVPIDLPAWMYHAQSPPAGIPKTESGVSWVDLVFPYFLFAMGVAIPIASSGRKQNPWLDALKRFGLLLALAIIHQHIQPLVWSSKPDFATHWTALGLFGLTVLMFLRAPRLPAWVHWVAWAVGGIGLLWAIGQHGHFDINRQNIILAVLAAVSLTGTGLWLLTRDRWQWRVGVLAALFAALALKPVVPWLKTVWEWTPAPWLYRAEFHKYLLIVGFGTLIGDLLLRAKSEESPEAASPPWLAAVVLAAHGAILPFTMNGMVPAAIGVTIAMGVAAHLLLPRGQWSTIMRWGTAMVLFGLVLTFWTQLRKDPTTLSYFFVGGGMGAWTLAACASLWPAKIGPVAWVGMNPLLAYVAISNVVWPLTRLTGLWDWLGNQGWGAWARAGFAVGQCLFLALFVSVFSKLRVFARS